ncbi:MAG TPA: hypothetical protein VFA99_10490 [Acidobacteriaceae bacterium]|nr:hypothetical protein [Acidobacteriaceae bacterium]
MLKTERVCVTFSATMAASEGCSYTSRLMTSSAWEGTEDRALLDNVHVRVLALPASA